MIKKIGQDKQTKAVRRNRADADPAFIYDPKTRRIRRHHKLRIALISLGLIVVAGGSAFAAHSYLSLSKVIQRNTGVAAAGLKGKLELSQLKGEGEGRVNILLLGVGDAGHSGSQLSDTMMVVSIDPQTNDVAMLGIPRDLWVSVPGLGYSKINNAHAYGEQQKAGGGPELAKSVVSTSLGVPIHYFVRADFTAFKQAVTSVGGVDITVEQALYDAEYPCERNESYSCGLSIKAGPQRMDGATALKYVRCRKGNCGDDFGRAKRQQQVLEALRSKALSLNTLLDPAKISGLVDTVGENIRTDLQIMEIQRLVDITKKLDTSKVVNVVLDNAEEGTNLVRTANIGGASVVVPVAGVGNYTVIQRFVRSIFVDGYIKQEAARLQVQNGTTKPGLGIAAANTLKSYSYNVVGVVAANAPTYATTQIIDYSGGKKPYTVKYLEKRFGVRSSMAQTVAPATAAGTQADPGPDVVVVVGADYKPTN